MAEQLFANSLWGDPKQILLEIAGIQQLSELLKAIVRRVTEMPNVALARTWLSRPPLPNDCATCRLASECDDRRKCLHLVASSGNPVAGGQENWSFVDGRFRRFPIGIRKVGHIAKTGQPLEVTNLSEPIPQWIVEPDWIRSEKIVAFAGEPLSYRDRVLGVFAVFTRAEIGESCLHWLRMIANHLAAAIANAQLLEEIDGLRRQLEQENEYLREEVGESSSFGELIGNSPALHSITRQIDLVAPTDSAVLILGDSGTGKELVAREIHRRSRRTKHPLIKVNCAAVPRELYESEFFGHARGSFTGALRDRVGRFELAHGGTLFLDEIGEIPRDLQAKLLRVLQEGELERIGEERTRRVDVRVIAATNRNLKLEAENGRFRQDLFYRLSVFPIELPPLRHRIEDIGLLANHFLDRLARNTGRKRPRLTLANVQELQRYEWPGNVRELQHVLERACIIATDGRLRFDLPSKTSLPEVIKPKQETNILTEREIRALEADNIRAAFAECSGKLYGSDGAAARLGMKPTTLASRIKSLGIGLDQERH